MRVCYLVPGALGAHAPDEAARRQSYLRRHAVGNAAVDLCDNPDGPASVESAAEEKAAGEGLQPLLPGLAAAGYDAVIIGCFGDPGMAAARDRVAIPVIGPARASFAVAAEHGDRFGVVTVVDDVVPLLRNLAHDYGHADALVDVRAVNVPVLQLRSRRNEALERLASAGRAAVDAGADALVLGCMTMGFLDVAEEISAALAVPVVNPVKAALHAAIDAGR